MPRKKKPQPPAHYEHKSLQCTELLDTGMHCNRPVHAKGVCYAHYFRRWRAKHKRRAGPRQPATPVGTPTQKREPKPLIYARVPAEVAKTILGDNARRYDGRGRGMYERAGAILAAFARLPATKRAAFLAGHLGRRAS